MAKSVREALAIVRHRPKEGWQVGGKETSGQREGRKPMEKGPLPLRLDLEEGYRWGTSWFGMRE